MWAGTGVRCWAGVLRRGSSRRRKQPCNLLAASHAGQCCHLPSLACGRHRLSSRAAMARLSRQSSSASAAEARASSGANSERRWVRRAAMAPSMSCAGREGRKEAGRRVLRRKVRLCIWWGKESCGLQAARLQGSPGPGQRREAGPEQGQQRRTVEGERARRWHCVGMGAAALHCTVRTTLRTPSPSPGCGAARRQTARSARVCARSGSTLPAPPAARVRRRQRGQWWHGVAAVMARRLLRAGRQLLRELLQCPSAAALKHTPS